MRRRPRSPKRAHVLAAAVLLLALAGGWLGLRDLALVRVERVSVAGVSGPDAPRIRAALAQAARGMTTLHVDGDRLRRAVQDFPTVRDLELDRSLPHGLTVRVLERTPVAVTTVAGRRVPVAADGRLLTGATPAADLPVFSEGRDQARLVRLLAAAPAPLRTRGRRAYVGDHGLTVALRDGPSLYFGRSQRLAAKWAAAARVLADPASQGARYLDLTVPERPAAGGVIPSTTASGSTTGTESPAQVELEG